MSFPRLATFSLAVLVAFAMPARADAGETTVDLSLGPLIGTHAEPGVSDTVAPVPIPILALAHRESAVEIFAEGLPVSPPITSSSRYESISTHLAFENVLLRGYAFHDRLSAGIGETIYNQASLYEPFDAVIASRVVGARYELAGSPLADRGFRVGVDLVPVLIGTIDRTTSRGFRLAPESERGSQSEFNVSYRRAASQHTRWEYGVRYINYVAHYAGTDLLADRNTGIRPYASFGVHF